MAAADSTSTDAQVIAAIEDNASYREDDSETKCRDFITACRVYLRRNIISSVTADGLTTQINPQFIADELKTALKWLDSKASPLSSTGRVRHYSVSGFRE